MLDTIKIKLLFTHNSEKSYFNLSLNCLIWNTKNHFKLAFYFMLTVSLKFSQTSLIIKELIKYENKFNRKVFRNFFLKINFKNFHFMKGSKKGYHEHFSVVLHNETIVKYKFHEMIWKKHFTMYPRLKAGRK